jgi:hypothetical protein
MEVSGLVTTSWTASDSGTCQADCVKFQLSVG